MRALIERAGGKRMCLYRFLLTIFFFILFSCTGRINALQNQYQLHDPSSIIKCEDNYWIFATGNGIHALYSNDLVSWTNGQNPFPSGYYPAWVRTYVPDFSGHYWAPECFYMNGRYYLYYSCSSWGSRNSCIGLLTSKSLNPNSVDYGWNDEGMVVYSTESGDVNCIDPAIFRDDEGKIWMTYGSHWDGIRIIELDSLTGKVIGGTHYPVASKGDYKTEAPYVINHGDYYYLFINRGQCCDGVNSTYYIQVGRSSSPSGPYLDKNGTDLYQGGGSTVLSTSGSMIGPGCLGYYKENNTEFVTWHYYDGTNSGRATLSIGTVEWDDNDWPVITSNWLEDGYYSIQNVHSNLYWDYSGTGKDKDPLIQNTQLQQPSQIWMFEALGNGYYSISPAGLDLVVMLKDCFGAPGTDINLGTPESKSCQIWKAEKTAFNSFMFSSQYGNRILEVPGASIDPGVTCQVALYSGGDNQKWSVIDSPEYVSLASISNTNQSAIVYPNPLSGKVFTIEFNQQEQPVDCEVTIISGEGKELFSEEYFSQHIITVDKQLDPQIYIIQIKTKNTLFCQKLIVQN